MLDNLNIMHKATCRVEEYSLHIKLWNLYGIWFFFSSVVSVFLQRRLCLLLLATGICLVQFWIFYQVTWGQLLKILRPKNPGMDQEDVATRRTTVRQYIANLS